MQNTREYVGIRAYARAKVLTAALTLVWARQWGGDDLAVAAVNPGTAWTPNIQALSREAIPSWRYVWPVMRYFQSHANPAKAAAACCRVVARSAEEINGRYFTPRGSPASLPTPLLDDTFQQRVLETAAHLEHEALSHPT